MAPKPMTPAPFTADFDTDPEPVLDFQDAREELTPPRAPSPPRSAPTNNSTSSGVGSGGVGGGAVPGANFAGSGSGSTGTLFASAVRSPNVTSRSPTRVNAATHRLRRKFATAGAQAKAKASPQRGSHPPRAQVASPQRGVGGGHQQQGGGGGARSERLRRLNVPQNQQPQPALQNQARQTERQQNQQRTTRQVSQKQTKADLRTLFESLDISTSSANRTTGKENSQSLVEDLLSSLPEALNLGEDADEQLYREVAEAMVRCRIRKRKASDSAGSAAPRTEVRVGVGVGAGAAGPTDEQDEMMGAAESAARAQSSARYNLLDDDVDSTDSDDGDGNVADNIGGPTDEGTGSSNEEWVKVSPTNNHANNDNDGSNGWNASLNGGLGGNQDESVISPTNPSDEEGEGRRNGGAGTNFFSSAAGAGAVEAADHLNKMKLNDDDDDDGVDHAFDTDAASCSGTANRAAAAGSGSGGSSGGGRLSPDGIVADRLRSLGLDGAGISPQNSCINSNANANGAHVAASSTLRGAAAANSAAQSIKFVAGSTAPCAAATPKTPPASTATTSTTSASASSVGKVPAQGTAEGGKQQQQRGSKVKGLKNLWEDFSSPAPPGTTAGNGSGTSAGVAVGGVEGSAGTVADDDGAEHDGDAGGTVQAALNRTADAKKEVEDDARQDGAVDMKSSYEASSYDSNGWPNDGPTGAAPSLSEPIATTTAAATTTVDEPETGQEEADSEAAAASTAQAAANAFTGTDENGFPSPANFASPPSSPELGMDSSFLFSPPENVAAAAAAAEAARNDSIDDEGERGVDANTNNEAATPATTFTFTSSTSNFAFVESTTAAAGLTPSRTGQVGTTAASPKPIPPPPHTNAKQGKMRRKVVGSATAGVGVAVNRPDPPGAASASATAADPTPTNASAPTTTTTTNTGSKPATSVSAEEPTLQPFSVDLKKSGRSTRRGLGKAAAGSSRGMRGSIRNLNPKGLNVNVNAGGLGAPSSSGTAAAATAVGTAGFDPAMKTPTESRVPEFKSSPSPMEVEHSTTPPRDERSASNAAAGNTGATSAGFSAPAGTGDAPRQSAAEAALSAAAAAAAAEAAANNVDESVRGSFAIGTGGGSGAQKIGSPSKANRANRTKLRQMRHGGKAKVSSKTPLAASDGGWGTGADDDGGDGNASFVDPYATQRQQPPLAHPEVSNGITGTSSNKEEEAEDFTGRDSHVEALRDEARDLYVQGRYKESIVTYTAAIRAQTRNFTTTTGNDEILAMLYGNRAAALMMVGGFDAAASDCQKALVNAPDEFGRCSRPESTPAKVWNLRPESGPALRSKLQCRMGRALLKAGKIDRSDTAFDAAIRTAEGALANYGRASLPQQATSILDQSMADATLNKRDIKRSRDATAGIYECCGGLPPNVAASDKKNGAQVLLYVNAALSTSPGDMDLHTQKIRLLASMKRWANLASHAEHLAADCVRFDGVFVDDLEPLHPFPGTPLAKNLTSDFFEANQDEDRTGTTSPRILDAKAVCDAVLRLPLAILPIYLRALRLEERYTEASRAASALDAHTRDMSTLTTRNLAWLSKEKGKLRRTMTTKESGDALFRTGDYERAAAKYASCLLIDGEGIDAAYVANDGSNAGGRLHAVLHCNRAACFMALRNYREAAKECTAALLIHSTYMKAKLRRARCFARLDRHQEAIGEYQQWIEMVEAAKKSPRAFMNEDTSCYFDRPMDVTNEDVAKARKELSEVKKAKVAKAEADANEEARANRQKWREEGAGADAYRRRQQWYDQGDEDSGSRRWDSFNGSSPKKPNGHGTRSQSYTAGGSGRAHGTRPGAYHQRSHSQQRPRPPMGSPGSDLARTHYEALGLNPTCTAAEIKKAYRKMALKYHPDKNQDPGAADMFRRVQLAYDTLSDDLGRRKYDAEMRLRHFGQF